jgi:hypothetical protein
MKEWRLSSMCKNAGRWLCGAVLVTLPLRVSAAADGAKEEQLAKAAATQFFKALNAKQLDDLMKVADVPWWSGDEELVKDRDELRKIMREVLDNLGEHKFPTEVTQVLTYAEARKKIEDAKTLAVLDKLLDRKDRIVVFGKDEHGLLVRIREGKARVIGGAR